MDKNIMLTIHKEKKNQKAIEFCNEFIHSDKPKYIFGRNEFAESVSKVIDINGFIDDFTKETTYLDKPIVNINDIPENALVLISLIGKPLLAEKRVKQFKFNYLDYYAFYKYSKLNIKQIMFWEGFVDDFKLNREKYEKIFALLEDDDSKKQFEKIINFRLSYDLDFMREFKDIEVLQYFEDFLHLKQEGESFVDIGGFDGYTSEEFIKKCPSYDSVYFFEPEEQNMKFAKQRFKDNSNINFFQLGLSDKRETLRFDISGSSSRISEKGSMQIEVDKLDELISGNVTFIKMDIEGAERAAIAGAKNIINKCHPVLAICVYHRFDDFWQIPEQIQVIRNDYKIYLRHYTEGVSETVMFFVPKIN